MSDRNVALAWIVLSSLVGVAGQSLAKLGLAELSLGTAPRAADVLKMLGSARIWAGGGLLVLGTLLWFYALSRIEFAVAMPVSCLLMLVFSVAAGIACFGEAIPPVRGAGLVLALVSVWLISR
jgi:drug/metabolite transporter (DMT)-like permease